MSARAAAVRRRRKRNPFAAAQLAPQVIAPMRCGRDGCGHGVVIHEIREGDGPCLVLGCACTKFVTEEES